MEIVVVERSFAEPVSIERVQETEDAHGWCLEMWGVRFKASYFSLDRRRMVCIYEAPDAEAVRRTQQTANLPFDRIWAATFHAKPAEEPVVPSAETRA